MKLEHSFTVPAPIDEAFKVLRDIERVAPCMPGATLGDVNGDEFTGTVKVKVGPITAQYKGSGKFVEVKKPNSATIEASGKEARGAGTAKATIVANLTEHGPEETEVSVVTDLAITGKAAQFGRGVMNDVGNKLLGQFADCLAQELGGGASEPEPEPEPEPAATTTTASNTTTTTADAPAPPPPPTQPQPQTSPRPRPTEDTIDLLDLAGSPVLKRALPVVGVVVVLAIIAWLISRGR
jgi:carbon monoxide dehydrogenase subunit G